MSWVANLLLSVARDEDPDLVEDFDRWLRSEAPWNVTSVPEGAKGVGFLRPLHDSPDAWGGWKNPEVLIWAAVTNHADVGAVVDRVAETEWRRPDAVQLMIQDQQEDWFRLWMIRDGQARQLTPELDDGRDD